MGSNSTTSTHKATDRPVAHHVARLRGEDELPVHLASVEHQRRWQAKGHVRLDQDQGCRPPLLQLGLKKADVDLNKRAGELTSEELERIVTIIKNPTWFLNRQRDIVDGKDIHTLANGVDSKLREDLERLKKIRAHRGLRHYWGLRVRGQHTKTTGRRGRTVGVSKRKGG